MGRNEVEAKSKVRGGQAQEEKEMGESRMEETPAGTEIGQDKAMLGREKEAMRPGAGEGRSWKPVGERVESWNTRQR